MGKIEFRTVEIEETIRKLAEFSLLLCNEPGLKKKEHEKYSRWVTDLEKILAQISLFEKSALPLITADLGSFKDRNLILTAMMMRGTRKTFNEIKKFGEDHQLPISKEDLKYLIDSPETAASLAWIGDSAINYAALLHVWEPGITPEKLHDKRKSLETNKNLSELCNRWNLYQCRFYQDCAERKEKKLEKIQGTFAEAIFGVIYVERDIQGVLEVLPLIDTTKGNRETAIF